MNEYRFYLTGKDASTWRRLVGRYYWLPDSQIISHLVEVHGLSCKDHCSLDSAPEADELGLPEFIYEDPDAEEETEPFTSLDGQVDQSSTDKTNSNAQSMDPQDFFCQGLNNTGPPPASLNNRWASTSAEEDQNGSFCLGAVITQNIHDSTQHKNQAAELSCEVTQGQESAPSRGAMETSLLLRCEQSPSVTQLAETDHSDVALQTLLLSAESELPPTQCNSSVLPLASTHGNLPNHSQTDQVNYTSCGPLNFTSHGVRVQRTMPSNYSETALSGNSKSVINCEAFNSTSITAYLHQDKNNPAFDKSVTKTVSSGVVEPALSRNSNSVAFNDGENLQSPLTATENLQSPLTATENLQSSLTATDNLQSTSTATENLQSPLTATDNLQSPLTATENLQSPLTATENLQSSLTATENLQSPLTATDNLQSTSTATDNLQSTSTATDNLQSTSTATDNLQSPLTATENLQSPLTATDNLQSTSIATDNLQCPLTAPFMPVIVSVESLSKVAEKESPEPDKSVAVPASSKQVLGKQPVVVLLKNKILHTLMEAQFIQTGEDKKAANQETVIQKSRTPTISYKPQEKEQPCDDSLVNQDSIPPPVVDLSDSSDPGYRSCKAPSKNLSPVKKTIQKPSRKNLTSPGMSSGVVEPALSRNSNSVAFNDGENLQSPLTATENLQSPLTATENLQSSLTATDNLQSTSTATENLQSPLTATDNLQSPLTATENLQSPLTATENLQSSLTATENLQSPLTATDNLQSTSTATDNLQSTSTATDNLQSTSTATDNLQSPLTATENLQSPLTATDNLQSTSIATDNLQCPLTAPFMPVIVSVESLSKVAEKESPEPDKSVAVPASSKQVLGKQPVVVLLKNKILHTLMEAQFIQTGEDKKAANQETVIQKSRTPTISYKPQEKEQPCDDSLVNQDSIPPPVVDLSDSSDPGYRSCKAPSKNLSPVKKTIQKPSRKNLEFGTKYPSPSKDTEAEGRKRKGKGRGNSKKKRRPDRFCVYCRQIIKGGRIADHMRGKHKFEPEVQAILKKPFEAQMKFFTAKRREGNYLYNLLLMDKGKNQPLMRERTQSRSKEDEIKVCSDCKGFYSKRCFFKHKCVSDDISRDTRRLRKVFMDNMEKDIGFQNILGRFVHGEIDDFCKSNNSIKTMGYQFYNTHRMKKGMSEEARQTALADMRELSRLFFHFRIICSTGRAVEDMFDTDNMKDLMEAMKLLEALNGSSNYTETGEESALYNTVLRMVKSLDEFYTCTRQFETKKDLVNFKKSFTSKIRRFTVKKQTRIPELDAPPEPSGNASMEADNGMCELIAEEPSTKQGTPEDTTKEGTFEITSSIISARKHITWDVNTEDTTTGMSAMEHITGEEISEQGTYVDASTNTSSRMPATEEGVRDVGTSDDSPKRKSGRTPVPKQFPDEVNGSAKRIRLGNVHSEAEEVTEKCPVEKIGRFSVKWSREETQLLKRHFHSFIYTQNDKDDNTGNLPGKKEIQAFLRSHTIGCIKELKEKTQIQKIRTKIFNERKTSRERGWKKLREMEAAKRTVN